MRRPFKKTIAILAVIGIPAAVIGVGLCIGAAAVASNALFVIGAIYLALGLVCLGLRAALASYGDALRRSRGARRSGEAKSGMALVTVLVIMALLSMLVMHSLRASSLAVRAGRVSALQDTLQRHAVDAAWFSVKAMPTANAAPGSYTTPDGAEVEISIRDVEPPPGLDVEGTKNRYQGISASATSNAVTREVYCVTRRNSAGELAVVQWVERP